MVTSADKCKSFYEDVVQIVDIKDRGIGTVDAETARTVLTEYMRTALSREFTHTNENASPVWLVGRER